MKADEGIKKLAEDLISENPETRARASETATLACELFYAIKELIDTEFPKGYLPNDLSDEDIASLAFSAVKQKAAVIHMVDKIQDAALAEVTKENGVKA